MWDGVLIKESRWAYPEVSSIKNNMLELHKDHGRFKKRAKELQKWVCEEFSQEKMYSKYVEAMLEVMPDPNAEDADDWFNDIEDIIKEYE